MEVHAVKTWFEKKSGVVVVEDDVQNVVRDIKQLSEGRVSVFFNEQSSEFDLVESCLDGTDRLVFSVKELDQRVVHRLRAGDHWHGNDTPEHVLGEDEDFLTAVDRQQDEEFAARDAESRGKLREAGERLAWALDIGRHTARASISVPKDLDG